MHFLRSYVIIDLGSISSNLKVKMLIVQTMAYNIF